MLPGRLLEPAGDGWPRGMIARVLGVTGAPPQNPAYEPLGPRQLSSWRDFFCARGRSGPRTRGGAGRTESHARSLTHGVSRTESHARSLPDRSLRGEDEGHLHRRRAARRGKRPPSHTTADAAPQAGIAPRIAIGARPLDLAVGADRDAHRDARGGGCAGIACVEGWLPTAAADARSEAAHGALDLARRE